eukprot:Gb_22234 [translate_table: standard]
MPCGPFFIGSKSHTAHASASSVQT